MVARQSCCRYLYFVVVVALHSFLEMSHADKLDAAASKEYHGGTRESWLVDIPATVTDAELKHKIDLFRARSPSALCAMHTVAYLEACNAKANFFTWPKVSNCAVCAAPLPDDAQARAPSFILFHPNGTVSVRRERVACIDHPADCFLASLCYDCEVTYLHYAELPLLTIPQVAKEIELRPELAMIIAQYAGARSGETEESCPRCLAVALQPKKRKAKMTAKDRQTKKARSFSH